MILLIDKKIVNKVKRHGNYPIFEIGPNIELNIELKLPLPNVLNVTLHNIIVNEKIINNNFGI